MEGKLNLRGMIHLDQIEDLLTNLVGTVDRQQTEIASLKLLCRSFVATQLSDENFRLVHTRIEDLASKLSQVHASATTKLEGKE